MDCAEGKDKIDPANNVESENGAEKGKDKVKRDNLKQEWDKGGMDFPDIRTS